MSEKKNYWTQAIGTQDSVIQFGGIGLKKDSASNFQIVAFDGRHFYSMDQDGTRPGYTTLVSPGVTQIQSGEDVNKDKISIFVNAVSGHIDILAENGDINMVGKNINIKANENMTIDATNNLDIDGKNVNIHAKARCSVSANSFFALEGKCGIQIFSKIIYGVSCATERPSSYLNTGG